VETDLFSLELGKFCLDIAKLIFAGIILANIMRSDYDAIAIIIIAIIAFVLLSFLGLYRIAHSKHK